ncbi:MAG: response regulator, partial [Deltaproteobacteria bacterium]|nr:response regulator [Deltaproteobacteria bacterium]
MKHIVTVGNPEILRLLTAEPLARAALTHEVVTSARAALDAVRRRASALLILDADTPDLDGLEVCRELRRHEELAACRVMLVVTGA